MAAPPLLHLKDIRLGFGGRPLLEGAELKVEPGERLCLVGRNGSGKSTLLKIAAGDIEPDRGERFVKPGITIRYLPQEPDLSALPNTLAYVEAGLAPGDDQHRALYLLNELGLTGQESTAALSGGEARRAALARVLAPEPDVLLLDEPTNHLDLPAIEWLEGELQAMRGALVLISHDRRFLETLSRATLWVDRGVTRRLDQGFGAFETWRDAVLEQEETERHKLDRAIVREEHWVRYGVTARRKRNQRRMRELEAKRSERREAKRATGTVTFAVSEADASGKLVVEADRIAKAFDGRAIVKDFSTRILRGDRVAFVGPNGAGKTTLVSMLTGRLQPDAGTVRLGVGLEIMTVDQARSTLDGNLSLKETLTSGDTVMVQGKPRHVMSYLKDFLFPPEQAGTPVGTLSGGERGRLALARGLLAPSNVMVLDEPTNDLDLETLDLLEEMIDDYPGTVLLVSHDRDFIDRTATAVIASTGDGRWIEYAGGYADMLLQRERGGEAALVRERPARAGRKDAPRNAPAAPADVAAPAAPRRKLSFKEKHALETLPRRIAELEAEIGRLNDELADPALYARNPTRFASATAALTEAQTALAQAEDDWLRLEMLKDEIGA